MHPPPSTRTPAVARTLIVDENPLLSLGVRQLVESETGLCFVDTCATARDALAILATTPADLVILELSETNGAGMDPIQELRAHHPHLRILVLSSQPEEVFAQRAIQAGASGFVSRSEEHTSELPVTPISRMPSSA